MTELAWRNSAAGRHLTRQVEMAARKALAENQGCRLSGNVLINKVPGNFHISGHHFPDAVQKLFVSGHKLDFSHRINHLSFGNLADLAEIDKSFGEKPDFELDDLYVPQNESIPVKDIGGPAALTANYFLDISQVDYLDHRSA